MIETAHTAHMQQAFARAHKERAEVFAKMFNWLFATRSAPLNQPVLTEPSRCA